MRFAYLESRGKLKKVRRLNQKSNEKEDKSLKHGFLRQENENPRRGKVELLHHHCCSLLREDSYEQETNKKARKW